MKKLIATLMTLMLVLPEFALAEEKTLPPVPASGNVTLPLDEYNRLLELASKPVHKADAPPVPYTMKRADLKFHVTDEAVQGTVQLQGEILRRGATKVPLTIGMAILDARQEGKSLPLELENGTHTAVLAGPAGFTVTLDAGLPLSIEAGKASFSLPVPAAGSARLTLIVPGDRTNVRINPGIITARSSGKGQTVIEATLIPGQATNIWWTTREVAVPVVPKEVRFLSDLKTLLSVSESEIRIATLADISVVQGEPTQFEIKIPAGYEVTGTTGASVESSEVEAGFLVLKVTGPAQRAYQFLISMEKSITTSQADAPFLSFESAQRETGEVLIEGAGTIELTAKEAGGLKRIDSKETNPYLRSLARFPMQAAFRYHKQPNETPSLALEWTRFPDSSVLSAVAERAVITTLVTTEGHSLTEVKLVIKNQAQSFLKVALPRGACILTAEIEGVKVKPVEGPDGNRIPLVRPGLRTGDSYTVSFVFMHSGTPFAKKGGSDLSLPKMDIPINLLQWEVFLPERYKVKDFGGDAIAANLLPLVSQDVSGAESDGDITGIPVAASMTNYESVSLLPGQLGGLIVDSSGMVVPGTRITITQVDTGAMRNVVTDSSGRWVVSNLPSGRIEIVANHPGFHQLVSQINYDGSRPMPTEYALSIGAVAESVEVSANYGNVDLQSLKRDAKKNAEKQQYAASVNVTNLQQRISGVLPVRVDVPRAGNSYHFVRPLVLDEETKVSFTYKSK
jgi:Carboxypeptidase regulatory-like domain